MLQHMFNIPIPLLEKILRPIIVYIFLVVLLRIFGKRELAQLNPFDLVVLLSLSNTVQNAIIGDDNSVAGGIVGAVSLLVMNYLVVRFLFKHRRLDEIIEGQPTVLMKDGVVNNKELASELISTAELVMIARRQGFDSLDDLQEIVLEPGGAFVMKAKKPTHEQHVDSKLDAILQEVAAIKASLAR
ncbi:MAG TPA: YetF domain-containing protein [Thermoanaerobaculia bacterium]